ncbi:FAD-dependent oxidoreductase [Maritimibacter dapengensis]|uniref:FAD-dependent oxidoreductase n=1 Tax=Maritimibacter dapengensis TaxID=2836868 RepID=A0ABS6T5U1_9RHOB|nr:FAD-dependent oxidoreductase [Maritimibacter dapengensis]MBV7380619.1 FAD-dependent oxidoreductase [Maritimibacter dapengensis]
MTEWDESFDVVVVGSGAGGFMGAIKAATAGLTVLLIEKADVWGGTSALSGGGVWVPNNPLMERDGDPDSPEEALTYMEEVVEDVGPASSRIRKIAYIANARRMMEFAMSQGFQWERARYYPDYYPDRPGGKIGRIVEGMIFDGKTLGEWRSSQRRSSQGAPAMAFKTDDVYLLPLATRTPKAALRLATILARTAWWKLTGREPMAIGQNLTAQLMSIFLKTTAELRLSTPLVGLVSGGGRVTGVVVRENGRDKRIEAKHGVLLAAGGFAHNEAFRSEHQPVDGTWSLSSPDDEGDGIIIPMADLPVATALMDEAWWGPSTQNAEGEMGFPVWERSLPHSIIVDQTGARFCNESESYVDAGRRQLDRNETVSAIPAWLILENRHRKRYMFGSAPGGRTPQRWLDTGFFIKSESLSDLAEACGIDKAGLLATVERFNGFADRGVDEDFGRGRTAYDNYYGDPRVKPNPNLGRLEQGPFYAVKIFPGDLGTKGGLLTDEYARAIDTGGKVIEGLYATGNNTASVMGRTYPGPGATLGPSLTFGFIAASHMAGEDVDLPNIGV